MWFLSMPNDLFLDLQKSGVLDSLFSLPTLVCRLLYITVEPPKDGDTIGKEPHVHFMDGVFY